MGISTEVFEKALVKLEEALKQQKNEFIRDSVIQRFEFTIELGWKISRKLMGTSSTAPKQVIREMAQAKMIDDVSVWLKAIDQRNLSAHTYNEDTAEEVYSFAKTFAPLARKLLVNLKKIS